MPSAGSRASAWYACHSCWRGRTGCGSRVSGCIAVHAQEPGGRCDEDARAVIQRPFVEVEAFVMMWMHDAAFLVARPNEEERAPGALLVGGEFLVDATPT